MRGSGRYQKGGDRILGDGDFVNYVLLQAYEQLEERYRIQAEGHNLGKLIERVGELLRMVPEEILERGKEMRRVEACSTLCYWAKDLLGISRRELAKA